jgi:hypothetical protein
VLCLVSPSTTAGNLKELLDNWEDGKEKDILGHTFDEEAWTASPVETKNDNGDNVSYTVSYLNYKNVQAFLIALNKVENENGTGVLPYQMFGMHYYTPNNREVFIGALLAFFMAYDDANGDGVPNTGENKTFVLPFGVEKATNGTYPPEASAVKITKKGEGHWQFGMQYKNMYALVTPTPLLPLIGWIAKFSELKITYDIKFNDETNEVTAETFYTIGQVKELWGYIAGFPPVKTDRSEISLSLGLSAVHFVTIFTSRYKVTGINTGNTVSAGIADEDVVIGVGEDNHRAFKIGFRGDFDLKDEDTGNTITTDEDAINILLQAKLVDLGLVAWQLAFSAGLFSIFAYALSDEVQSKYSSPRDLAEKSLRPFNPQGFGVHALWYAVCFPSWQGYRVEHDPQYTAYVTFNPEISEDEDEKRTPGFEVVILIAGIGLIAMISRKNRFKK